MAGEAAGPGEGPVEDGDRALGDEIVDPPAGGGRVAEEEDGRRPEVRVDEDIVEPSYGEDGVNLGESSGAAHGSHGSHGGTSAFEPAVPPADRQRPVPMTLDEGVGQRVDRDARENAYEAMERRSEDVSQVARSLAYMTSLVTTLVGRMDRVEQAQTSSGRRTATTSARMETPMVGTPEAGSLGWVDLRRLDAQLGRMSLEAGDQQLSMERPLATMDSIMAGTFSSDDSQTARRRLEQERGVPGSLLGPLAAPLAPVVLSIGAPGEAELEMARRSLQERAAEALAAERQRLSQEPPLVGSTPPPGLMQLPSIPQGSATAPMQLPSIPQGSAIAPTQLQSVPQGSTTAPTQLPGAPQGSITASSPLPGAPQGSAAALALLPGAPQGSLTTSMQLQSAPQGSLTTSTQLQSAPQGSTMASGPLPSTTQDVASAGMQISAGVQEGIGVSSADRSQETSQPGTSFVSATSEVVQGQGQPDSAAMKMDGLVIGAPPSGLVFVQGEWRPYMMVQGQMVIQSVSAVKASAAGLSLAAQAYDPATGPGLDDGVRPPPPPPPPRSPTTPRRGTTLGNNATPGGTPVPPPPPSTPATGTSGGPGSTSPGEVEEPSKLVMKLPPLMASKGTDAAVVAGDWLAQLEPSMASLSSTASTWWQQIMMKVRELYQRWLESTPVDRLQIRQSVLAERPPLDRWSSRGLRCCCWTVCRRTSRRKQCQCGRLRCLQWCFWYIAPFSRVGQQRRPFCFTS